MRHEAQRDRQRPPTARFWRFKDMSLAMRNEVLSSEGRMKSSRASKLVLEHSAFAAKLWQSTRPRQTALGIGSIVELEN